ncbi:Uncharacterized protein Rs2_26669 [Raphanus sativus]|nr:Uncharacterized protein Rs2_26669 [Raphanus sativus]
MPYGTCEKHEELKQHITAAKRNPAETARRFTGPHRKQTLPLIPLHHLCFFYWRASIERSRSHTETKPPTTRVEIQHLHFIRLHHFTSDHWRASIDQDRDLIQTHQAIKSSLKNTIGIEQSRHLNRNYHSRTP